MNLRNYKSHQIEPTSICHHQLLGFAGPGIQAVLHSIRDLFFQMSFDGKLAEKCENSSFFVPKSMDDLRKITPKIKMDHLEQPVRIWTDYERFNRSHFWSETANEWWQSVNHGGFLEQWKFKDSVVFNGYKKLKNYRPPIIGCCICVVKQEMKWHFKCLILFFIASFVFAVVAMALGFYCKHYWSLQ